jgi:hypothetical protein
MMDITQIIAAVLITGGASLFAGPPVFKFAKSKFTSKATARLADAKPPAGAVEYVQDIEDALLGASAETVLQCIRMGFTRDEARSVRIQELLKKETET